MLTFILPTLLVLNIAGNPPKSSISEVFLDKDENNVSSSLRAILFSKESDCILYSLSNFPRLSAIVVFISRLFISLPLTRRKLSTSENEITLYLPNN